jgi:hypothetical protein
MVTLSRGRGVVGFSSIQRLACSSASSPANSCTRASASNSRQSCTCSATHSSSTVLDRNQSGGRNPGRTGTFDGASYSIPHNHP